MHETKANNVLRSQALTRINNEEAFASAATALSLHSGLASTVLLL